jgi:hypothetical protein
MPQPWDVPPAPGSGDSHEDAISLAVGRALTSWEFIEEALADIFAIFVKADVADPEKAPALRAYGSVITARGRADMLQAAGEAHFFSNQAPQLESDFKAVLRSYRGFAGRRNDVAHGRAGQDSQNPAHGWYLYPGSTIRRNIRSASRRRISTVRLKSTASKAPLKRSTTRLSIWRPGCKAMRPTFLRTRSPRSRPTQTRWAVVQARRVPARRRGAFPG